MKNFTRFHGFVHHSSISSFLECSIDVFLLVGFLQLIDAGMSSKIMKEALAQQKEIADEENAEKNPNIAAFAVAAAVAAGEEQRVREQEDDIDDFDGKFENQTQFDDYQVSKLILSTGLFCFDVYEF